MLEPEAAVELLNTFFDCLVPPIEQEGGEILKYMGDGLLAIFRDHGDDTGSSAQSALSAAIAGLVRLDEANKAGRFPAQIEAGIALHHGDAAYGNVGSGTRLDFTVIGRDVNLASRIAQMNKVLAEPLLMSRAFADHLWGDPERIGEHTLDGFLEPRADLPAAECRTRSATSRRRASRAAARRFGLRRRVARHRGRGDWGPPTGSTDISRASARTCPEPACRALIRDGQVTIDGQPVRDPAARPSLGATITVEEPSAALAEPRAEAIDLAIVFEDDQVVVLNKPAGLVVHPGAGHETGTLVNALIAHCGDSLSGIGGVRRPGIVHRLDKGTSGLLVVAKTDLAHRSLAAQFADHGRTGVMERAYLAFVWGVPDPRSGSINASIGRHATQRMKLSVVPDGRGRRAVTRYRVEQILAGGRVSLLRCTLETGRTHQIRVHLAARRHPLLADAAYGTGFVTKAMQLTPAAQAVVADLGRPALHATLLQFRHPRTKEVMRFVSDLPADLEGLQHALENPTCERAPRTG